MDRAVEIVRAAQLDIFLLGALFQSYDEVAAIAAHRLAPVQVAPMAVSPMTTGLRSFDVVVNSPTREPRDALDSAAFGQHLAAVLTGLAGLSPAATTPSPPSFGP